jgi:hypothetical protein
VLSDNKGTSSLISLSLSDLLFASKSDNEQTPGADKGRFSIANILPHEVLFSTFIIELNNVNCPTVAFNNGPDNEKVRFEHGVDESKQFALLNHYLC